MHRDHPAFPHANGFNGFLRNLPGDRALLSPSPAEISSADLTPASRRQDHTTSPSASALFVKSASASIASLPYVRDDRETPLCVGGDGEGCRSDLGQKEMKIFLRTGLDARMTTTPDGQISTRRRCDGQHNNFLTGAPRRISQRVSLSAFRAADLCVAGPLAPSS